MISKKELMYRIIDLEARVMALEEPPRKKTVKKTKKILTEKG